MPTDYSEIKLTNQQIDSGEYKKYLGGGKDQWAKRGSFQLELLSWLGLKKSHVLLDVGCGPLRGGTHFIKYLNPGQYYGVDYNQSLLDAAQHVVETEKLDKRKCHLSLIKNFNFAELKNQFDFILCFSVLNHCSKAERKLFFKNVPKVMTKNTRLIITHADWFTTDECEVAPLSVKQAFKSESDLAPHLKLKNWGFKETGNRLPILEFRLG